MFCKHCDQPVDGRHMLFSRHLRDVHGITAGPGLARRDYTRTADEPIEERP